MIIPIGVGVVHGRKCIRWESNHLTVPLQRFALHYSWESIFICIISLFSKLLMHKTLPLTFMTVRNKSKLLQNSLGYIWNKLWMNTDVLKGFSKQGVHIFLLIIFVAMENNTNTICNKFSAVHPIGWILYI